MSSSSESSGKSDKKSEETDYSYKDDDVVLFGFPRNEEEKHCYPYYDWTISIACRFDISFVIILVLENINFGLWVLVTLCQVDLFKTYYGLDRMDLTIYHTVVVCPWSLRVLYGLISDSIPIFGLKRKPYLIFFGFVQGVFMFICYTYTYIGDSPSTVAFYLFMAGLANAFSNTVIDAIMVI